MIKANSLLLQQIIVLSSQLSPIMDRMGRLMTDYSPHMISQVNSFNDDLREFDVDEADEELDSI